MAQQLTENRILIELKQDTQIEEYFVPAGTYDGYEKYTTLIGIAGKQSTTPRYQIELEDEIHKNPRYVSVCCDCTALIKSGIASIIG